MTQPLNFRAERDAHTTSWQRADPVSALIERTDDRAGYLITLPGGAAHTVAYHYRDGARFGRCDCSGWDYRDDPQSPCAHLCVLRKAEWSQRHFADDPRTLTTDGERVKPTTDDHARTDAGRTVATDGGHVEPPAAGHDGRTFGRPEGEL